VECTRFPVSIPPEHEEIEEEGALLRAADLIGQLGDPHYLRKANALYYEFEEAGLNRQLGYGSPADLVDRYPQFYWNSVSPRIETAIRYLNVTASGRHWIATAVGMAILEKGGNAFDAAVATAFALQVVEPHLNGPGGDVPLILHDARRGRTEVICGQGPAPAGATIAHFRALGLDMVPGSGLLAACVPGMFETWMLLLR